MSIRVTLCIQSVTATHLVRRRTHPLPWRSPFALQSLMTQTMAFRQIAAGALDSPHIRAGQLAGTSALISGRDGIGVAGTRSGLRPLEGRTLGAQSAGAASTSCLATNSLRLPTPRFSEVRLQVVVHGSN